jgi:hypothetical protein
MLNIIGLGSTTVMHLVAVTVVSIHHTIFKIYSASCNILVSFVHGMYKDSIVPPSAIIVTVATPS